MYPCYDHYKEGKNMQQNAFEKRSPFKTYMGLAMPVVVGMVITIIYNIVDTYFVARTGNTAMIAGVSLCAPIFTILMAFGNIFGQGGSSLIARLYGQKNTDDTKRVSSFCFYTALLTGAAVGLILLVFNGLFLSLLGANGDTMAHARPYYLVMACGAPFLVANFVHTNLMRAEGMAKESMIGNILGVAVNIVLDPILILVLRMNAMGAALASVIGYITTDLFMLLMVLKKSRILSVDPRLMRIRGRYFLQIGGVGLSAAITNWMSSLCMIIINQYLLVYGVRSIAAMGVCQKMSMIVLLVATGMVFGGAPLIGYFYGARRFKELKRILRMILLIVEGVTITISLLVLLAAEPLASVFLTEKALVAEAAMMLRLQVITMFLAVAIMLATVCFQASGLAIPALIVSVMRQGVVFFCVIVAAKSIWGYHGIITAQAITDVVTAVIVAVIFMLTFMRRCREPEGEMAK